MPRYKMVNGERIQLTTEEEAAKDAEEAAWEAGAKDRAIDDLRQKRNNLLQETDYYALSDVTMSTDMQNYRQSLRDLTNSISDDDTADDVKAIVFPTKP